MSNRCYSIGIDCRFWGIRHAGLGRYTRELVLAMVGMKLQNVHFTLFFQKEEWEEDCQLLKDHRIVEVGIPHYSLSEQLRFWKTVDGCSLDLVHFPHFNIPVLTKTPFVVTIHDLIKHFFKGKPVTTRNLLVYWLKYGGYRFVIQQAIMRSQHIIVPSLFTKDQIAVHYPGCERKISVIYEGVSPEYQESKASPASQVMEKYSLDTPYFVYTGSAYPSKNVPALLNATKLLITEGIQVKLLIACARNVFWEKLKNEVVGMNLGPHVLLPGSVPDSDLAILYKNAQGFVMPSHMEGFGLPALEAMSAGCPVIASSTGSLPEIYDNGALYFHPDKPDELAAIMKQVMILSQRERTQLIENGKKRAGQFQWSKAADETVRVYTKVLDELSVQSSYSST